MASNRDVVSIGVDLSGLDWPSVQWLDPAGLDDFDIVLLDPNMFLWGQARTGHQAANGIDVIGSMTSPDVFAMLRMASEIDNLLARGGDVVAFATMPRQAFVHDSSGRISGWAFLGLGDQFTQSEGRKVQVANKGPIGQFLAAHLNEVEYKVTLNLPNDGEWTVLATTKQGSPVGAIRQRPGEGRFLLLPWINHAFTKRAEANSLLRPNAVVADVGRAKKFWGSLIDALLADAIERAPAPEWADQYSTVVEAEARVALEDMQAQLAAAERNVSTAVGALAAAEMFKPLLYATGDELEAAVKGAFELLGGKSLDVPANEEDLLMDFDGWQGVFEVKGVVKSASQENARQLEQWATKHENAKPILVVNAFRETSPVSRPKESFPAQMVPYSSGREHALMTTVQLYVALDQIQSGVLSASEFLSGLNMTVGVLEGFEVGLLARHA